MILDSTTGFKIFELHDPISWERLIAGKCVSLILKNLKEKGSWGLLDPSKQSLQV